MILFGRINYKWETRLKNALAASDVLWQAEAQVARVGANWGQATEQE